MRVLIVGSLHHNPPQAVRDQFVAACREIGAELAKAKFDFVVGSSSPTTADRYVVEGAAKVQGVRKLFFFRTEDGATPEIPAEGDSKFSVSFRRLQGPWAAGRVPQIQAADCILLIGGSRGTAQVGYAAIALEKPVVAVGSFGGATAELWPQLEPFYSRLGSLGDRIGNLRESWRADNAALVPRALTQLVRHKVFKRRTGLREASLLLALNVALFSVWVWLFIAPVRPLQAAFFGLLAASSFLGTALRTALSAVSRAVDRAPAEILVSEFSAGLTLAFALALLYLAGSFTFTGKPNALSGTSTLEDYQRIAISMGLIGIAGGWLIERVAGFLRGWFGDQLPESTK